jgi:hypothetical protein
MKTKSDWVIYRFRKSKRKDSQEEVVILTTWSKTARWWSWIGIVTEDQIKKILHPKQFSQWKQGKRTEFMRHFTIKERKSILKLNNKKRNE